MRRRVANRYECFELSSVPFSGLVSHPILGVGDRGYEDINTSATPVTIY